MNVKGENLSVGYSVGRKKNPILEKLQFSMSKGELIFLTGLNGSGKTTLLKTIASSLKPLDGNVLYNNRSVDKITAGEFSRLISIVLTGKSTFGNITVKELVELGRYPYTGWFGTLSSEDIRIIENALQLTGITSFSERKIAELSDGEKQKALIARALAQDTPVLLLDEPATHLDLKNRVEVMDILKNLVKTKKKTVLLTTHHIDLALQYADILWLIHGKDFIKGAPEDLVLQGWIEKVFGGANVEFDPETGVFRNKLSTARKINVRGEGVGFKWTVNALRKSGYTLANDFEDLIVDVEPNENSYTWFVHRSGKRDHVNSIAEMLDMLALSKRD